MTLLVTHDNPKSQPYIEKNMASTLSKAAFCGIIAFGSMSTIAPEFNFKAISRGPSLIKYAKTDLTQVSSVSNANFYVDSSQFTASAVLKTSALEYIVPIATKSVVTEASTMNTQRRMKSITGKAVSKGRLSPITTRYELEGDIQRVLSRPKVLSSSIASTVDRRGTFPSGRK